MASIKRKEPRVAALLFLWLPLAPPVPPYRHYLKLVAVLRIALVVDEEKEPPPVPVRRENRPQHVSDFALAGIDRAQSREVAFLLPERPHLDRKCKERLSEHCF